MKQPSFFRGFGHAWRGLILGFTQERSFRIQSFLALLALLTACLLPLSVFERLSIFFVVFLVLVLELINSALERTVDLLKPRLDEAVKEVKDLMAGAVLLAAFFACVVGLMIFGPYALRALVFLV